MQRIRLSTRLKAWHERWLLTGYGERTRQTVLGLNWVVSSAFFARLVCGLTTVLAARSMGPAEFGQANLALAATYYIQIFFLLGVPVAITHYVPQVAAEQKNAWMIDGLRLTAVFAAISLAVGYGARELWAGRLGLSVFDFDLALLWSAGNFLYMLATAYFNAQERFRGKAMLELGFSLLFPLLGLSAWKGGWLSGHAYVAILGLSYGVAGLVGLAPAFRSVIHLRPHWERLKPLLAYGVIASVGSLVTALMQSPARLIAHRSLSLAEIGILSSYQGGSVQMALFLLATAMQVFFPIASRTPDKPLLFMKIHRFFLAALPVVFVSLVAAVSLYFTLLGRHYPLNFVPTVAFAFGAALALHQGVLLWFFASIGRHGMLASSLIGLAGGLVNVIGCFLWIPRYQLTGAAAAMIAAYGTGILLCYLPWVHEKAGAR